MATELNPVGDTSSADIAAADAAATNLLLNSRRGVESLKPEASPERESALDEAFAEFASATPPAEEATPGRGNGGVKVPTPGTPAAKESAQPAPEEKTTPAKVKSEAPKTPEKPARKGLLGDLIDEPETPVADAPEKAYEDIKLRSDASPKTQETFNAVKSRALEREAAVKAELDKASARALELETKLTEIEKKVGAVPEPVQNELKELREFRALHDVSSRPEFKEKFDSHIQANYEAVYSLFTQEGLSDANVAELKKMSEDARMDYIEKSVLPRLTAGQKRVVEAKLFDNVNISQEKEKALGEAKTNAEKILAEQRELPAREQQAKDKEFADVLRPMLQKLPYVYFKEAPSTATPVEKAAVEAHNAFAQELQNDIKTALADQSPRTRAEVIAAVPLARYLSKQVSTLTARAEAAEKKLEAIAKAGNTGRLGKSAAAPETLSAPTRGTDTDGHTAVDDLFAQFSGSQR